MGMAQGSGMMMAGGMGMGYGMMQDAGIGYGMMQDGGMAYGMGQDGGMVMGGGMNAVPSLMSNGQQMGSVGGRQQMAGSSMSSQGSGVNPSSGTVNLLLGLTQMLRLESTSFTACPMYLFCLFYALLFISSPLSFSTRYFIHGSSLHK